MTGHTPGPWTDGNEAIHSRMDRSRPWCGTVFRKRHDGTEADALVAMSFSGTPEGAGADARLIAAAPDMKAALEAIMAVLPSNSSAYRIAQQTLAKVEPAP